MIKIINMLSIIFLTSCVGDFELPTTGSGDSTHKNGITDDDDRKKISELEFQDPGLNTCVQRWTTKLDLAYADQITELDCREIPGRLIKDRLECFEEGAEFFGGKLILSSQAPDYCTLPDLCNCLTRFMGFKNACVVPVEDKEGIWMCVDTENLQDSIFSASQFELLPNLKTLNLSDQVLTELDLSGAQQLETLVLNNTALLHLDLTQNIKLKKLEIVDSLIAEIDVSEATKLNSLIVKRITPDHTLLRNINRRASMQFDEQNLLDARSINLKVFNFSEIKELNLTSKKFDYTGITSLMRLNAEVKSDVLLRNKNLEHVDVRLIDKPVLDLSDHRKLKYLEVFSEKVFSMNLPQQLEELIANGWKMDSINIPVGLVRAKMPAAASYTKVSENAELQFLDLDGEFTKGELPLDLSLFKKLEKLTLQGFDAKQQLDLSKNTQLKALQLREVGGDTKLLMSPSLAEIAIYGEPSFSNLFNYPWPESVEKLWVSGIDAKGNDGIFQLGNLPELQKLEFDSVKHLRTIDLGRAPKLTDLYSRLSPIEDIVFTGLEREMQMGKINLQSTKIPKSRIKLLIEEAHNYFNRVDITGTL